MGFDSDEYSDLDYDEFTFDSGKACCYLIDGEKVWIPNSLHEKDDDPQVKKIWVKSWFANKEGLI